VIASNQFNSASANNAAPDGVYQILVALDTAGAANQAYSVWTINNVAANTVNGEAKILTFRGLSASSVDTASVSVGNGRTVLGTATTSFATGDDVAIGAMEMEAVGSTRTIVTGADDIRRTGEMTGSGNQFGQTVSTLFNDGSGLYKGYLRKVSTTTSNPSYEGARPDHPESRQVREDLGHVPDAGPTGQLLELGHCDRGGRHGAGIHADHLHGLGQQSAHRLELFEDERNGVLQEQGRRDMESDHLLGYDLHGRVRRCLPTDRLRESHPLLRGCYERDPVRGVQGPRGWQMRESCELHEVERHRGLRYGGLGLDRQQLFGVSRWRFGGDYDQ